MAHHLKITAVTCVKNEGPFLLEWIAFHQCIGVTDFLFYSNDCDDGTDTLLDALAELGHLRHLPNPAEGRNYQMEALKHAKTQDIVTEADWVWVADVDEFPNIHVGDNSLPALIHACGNPQTISLNFQFFANNDIEAFVDSPVIGQFTRSHNPDLWCGESAIEVKSLVQKDFPLKYYGAHRPFFQDKIKKREPPQLDRWLGPCCSTPLFGGRQPAPHPPLSRRRIAGLCDTEPLRPAQSRQLSGEK